MAERIGNPRIAGVSLDCRDHRELGEFYARLLDGIVMWSTETATGVRAGTYLLVAQEVREYLPPAWPESSIVHLDVTCDEGDLPEFEERALDCGAVLAEYQPDERWIVMLDPAGHPFCLTPFAG